MPRSNHGNGKGRRQWFRLRNRNRCPLGCMNFPVGGRRGMERKKKEKAEKAKQEEAKTT